MGGGGGSSRRSARKLSADPARFRRRRAAGHVWRAGRRASPAQGAHADRDVERRDGGDHQGSAGAASAVGGSRPRHAERDLSRNRGRGGMNMLWYKSWLETRWRFLIGLVLLLFSALSTVFTYPQV